MLNVTRVGVDLAKNLIQVCAVDASGKVLANKSLPRDKFLAWCTEQLPSECLVAMEASSGSHHWARELNKRGFTAKIISASLVGPYRMEGKGGKNDANDAFTVSEAAARPKMRFVPVKSRHPQGLLCAHRIREGFKKERTGIINRIRGLLAEFGLVVSKSLNLAVARKRRPWFEGLWANANEPVDWSYRPQPG